MRAEDDSAWRRLDLPHDWSVEDIPGGTAPDQIGPFDKKEIGTTEPMAVRIYTSADRIEVRLNGRKLAENTLTAADKNARRSFPFLMRLTCWKSLPIAARRPSDVVGW